VTPGSPGHVDDAAVVVECQCGGDRFHVRVVVDDESVDGPLVSECAGCGRSDVAGDAGATTARVVAETDDWPGWEFGW